MPPSPWIGSFPKAGGPPSQIPPAPGTIPMSIVRQMTQTTDSSGRVTICGPERHIQVECQDAATLTNMVTHLTAHEQNMLQQVLNTTDFASANFDATAITISNDDDNVSKSVVLSNVWASE